jgi:hypothetical protein
MSASQNQNITNVVELESVTERIDLQHMAEYRTKLRAFNEPHGALDDLLNACNHLFKAAILGNDQAQLEMTKFPKNKKLMQYEYSKIILLEYMDRLKNISSVSSHFEFAQKELAEILFNFNQENIYTSTTKRFHELCKAFYHKHNALNDLNDLTGDIQSIIENRALTVLINEMCGDNIMQKKISEFCFPFQIKSIKALRQELQELLPQKKSKIESYIIKYQESEEDHVYKTIVKPEGTKFKLNLDLSKLKDAKDNIICFYNDLQGEIARVRVINGQIKFEIFGYDVDLSISGTIDEDNLTLINTGATIQLNANIKLNNDLLISADTSSITITGKIENSENVNASLSIEARNKVEFTQDSKILLQNQFLLGAESAIFSGKVFAKGSIQLTVKNSITVAHEAEFVGEADFRIHANAISDLRGKLEFKGLIDINLNDSAYIHGGASIKSSDNNVRINARQLMTTDKAVISAAKKLEVFLRDNLSIDKESSWDAKECIISARNFENYSPNFKAGKATVLCKDTFTNYSTGMITTIDSFVVQGWHCWNGGKINFGKVMKLKLNGIFVHGIANFSIEDIKNAPWTTCIKGDSLNIVAGVVFNALGYVNANHFNLTALVEGGPSFTITRTMKKTRFFKADLTVNLPNFNAMVTDLNQLWQSVKKRELPKDSAMLSSMNIITVVRWVGEILFPGAIKPIDALWTIAMGLLNAQSIYIQICILYQKCKNGEKVEPSDVYELIGTISSIAMLGINAVNQLENLTYEDFDFYPKLSGEKAFSVALSVASVLLPSSIDDSVFGISSGMNIGGSITSRSGLTSDFSFDFGFNISHLFIAARELDLEIGYNISNTGVKLQRDGFQLSHNNIANVSEEKVSATIFATNETHLNIDIERNNVSHVKNLVIRATGNETETKESETTAEKIDVVAKNIELHSHIHGTAKHVAPADEKSASPETKDSKETAPEATPVAPEAKDPNAEAIVPEDKLKNELIPDIRYIASGNLETGKDSVVDALGSTVVMVGDHATIEGAAHAQNLYNQGKTFLDVKPDADQSATKALVLKGAAGSLKGHVTADALIIDIDHGLNVKDILDLHNGFEHYKPISYLGIETKDNVVLGEDIFKIEGYYVPPTEYNFAYSVGIHTSEQIFTWKCKMHTNGSFIFNGDKGIMNLYDDISADDKVIMLSKGGVYNGATDIKGKDIFIDASAFVNNGGTTKADNFLQINTKRPKTNSAGSIYNTGSLIGGAGVGYDNVGLRLATNGYIVNFEGTIASPSDSDLDAGLGVSNTRREPMDDFLKDRFSPEQLAMMNLDGSPSIMVSKGREIVRTETGDIENDRGCLMSANELSLQNHSGNIINWGGILQAQTYLEEIAGGDVINKCYVTNLLGRWSIVQRYEPGYTLGGTGIGHDGIGLFVSAKGHIINDASIFSTPGTQYFSGDQGIISFARHNRYIVSHTESNSMFGDTETTVYANQLQPAMFVSTNGSNIFYSSAGGIDFLTTTALAAGDNEFAALHDIYLHSLILNDVTETSSSSFFGMENSYSRQEDEYVAPTTIENINNITFISLDGCVKILDTLLVNSGKLTVRARDLVISATILNHSYEAETNGFNFNLPNMSPNNIAPLIPDFRNLMTSQSALELGANAWNLAFNGLNNANGIVAGIRNNNLAQAFAPTAFLPTLEIGYGRSHIEAHWQTIPNNIGVYTGSADLQVSNSITFDHAVPIYVSGDALIRAHIFNQFGAELNSSMSADSQNFTLGCSVDGNFNFGESASGFTTHGTHYQHQMFNVGGTLDIGVDEWNMQDANLIASILNAHVGNLSIVSHLDTFATNSWSESLNTNGNFSFGGSLSNSGTIGMPSGILTTHGATIDAGVITLQGGSIVSYGYSNVTANTINSIPVREYGHSSSFNIAGNLHDFNSQTAAGSLQSMPSVSLNVGRQNYQADRNGTIWNSAGTPVQAHTINGDLNQATADGLRVIKDDHFNVQLKVPIFNAAGSSLFSDNLRWLMSSSQTTRPIKPVRQYPNDDLYDPDGEDEFDDLPTLDDDKDESDDHSDSTPKTKSKVSLAHSNTHSISKTEVDKALPDISLDLNHLNLSHMNEDAHADDEKKSEPSNKPIKGTSNLDNDDQVQHCADMAFRGRDTSSTGRIFEKFRDTSPSMYEDKEDFSEDYAKEVRRVDVRVPGLRKERPGYMSMNDSFFGQETNSRDEDWPIENKGENISQWQTFINDLVELNNSSIVAAINRVGDELNPFIVVPEYAQDAINQFSEGHILYGLNSSAGAILSVVNVLPELRLAKLGFMSAAEELAAHVNKLDLFGDASFTISKKAESLEYKFKPGLDIEHYEKHLDQFEKVFGFENYTLEDYIHDANLVIKNGKYVPELHGYVAIAGGKGYAKGIFVGLDRETNEITSMHLKGLKFYEKKAPSLGWIRKPASEATDIKGPNQNWGYRSPYRGNK